MRSVWLFRVHNYTSHTSTWPWSITLDMFVNIAQFSVMSELTLNLNLNIFKISVDQMLTYIKVIPEITCIVHMVLQLLEIPWISLIFIFILDSPRTSLRNLPINDFLLESPRFLFKIQNIYFHNILFHIKLKTNQRRTIWKLTTVKRYFLQKSIIY